MASDEISMDGTEKTDAIGEDEDDEEEYYDCEDLRTCRYKFRTKSIDGIIPLPNRQVFLLSSDTVYLCDLDKDDFNARSILSGVHQVAHIPASGDVLCVMVGFSEIKRISPGNVVTCFVYTTSRYEKLISASSGGNEAYACTLQDCNEKKFFNKVYNVNLFNESGVVLKKFDFYVSMNFTWDSIKTTDKNICVRANYIHNCVRLIDLQQHERIQVYSGSIGINPGSRFRVTDMTIDGQNNILLAVHNDNAIHLLDESLTFQKLLMTAEDGLHRPSSVALDSEGYLWVGCEDGQIHIENYHYLLNTDRQTRLKIKQMAV
jgi:WD40 repeat protein